MGHISGGHFNPAGSIGLFMGRRFDKEKLVPYIVSQALGAAAYATILYLIVSSSADFIGVGTRSGAFASNFYDADVHRANFGIVSELFAELRLIL